MCRAEPAKLRTGQATASIGLADARSALNREAKPWRTLAGRAGFQRARSHAWPKNELGERLTATCRHRVSNWGTTDSAAS
jgi:hypothetical protein